MRCMCWQQTAPRVLAIGLALDWCATLIAALRDHPVIHHHLRSIPWPWQSHHSITCNTFWGVWHKLHSSRHVDPEEPQKHRKSAIPGKYPMISHVFPISLRWNTRDAPQGAVRSIGTLDQWSDCQSAQPRAGSPAWAPLGLPLGAATGHPPLTVPSSAGPSGITTQTFIVKEQSGARYFLTFDQ